MGAVLACLISCVEFGCIRHLQTLDVVQVGSVVSALRGNVKESTLQPLSVQSSNSIPIAAFGRFHNVSGRMRSMFMA